MILKKLSGEKIEVEIGIPHFNSQDKISKKNFFMHNGKKYKFDSVSVGNPHAVFLVKDIEKINLEEFSKNFSKKRFYKNGVNVSIIQNGKKNIWKASI